MFYGEHKNGLDDKNRVAIPAAMRKAMDAQTGAHIYLCRGLDNNLLLMTQTQWEKMESWLQGERGDNMLKTSKHSKIERWIYGGLHQDQMDSQGRIKIPEKLRSHAGLEDEVVFVGMGNKIELWSPGRWEDVQYGLDADDVKDLEF